MAIARQLAAWQPSGFGSDARELDRMTYQDKSWRQTSLSVGDCELDDCDREDETPPR
jgi:hypothetical protein